jgi:RNA polymerase sigma factor (sigma-70 family)
VETPLDSFDVTRLLEGDGMAWREFVRESAPLLRSIVRRTLTPSGRAADTPDVLQKIYIRFCANDFNVLRPFDPHKGRLSSWLAVIAARAAIDHLRAHGAVLTSLETQPETADVSQPERADTGPLALPPDLLSPQQELILRLCYEDDLDVADIAQVLRTQPQTIRSQRHKALERLRAYLAKRTFF